ncbi:hypothetical protein [Engelhardtia mirabilis]|uniref:Translocation protein TolB n=1 Tax=Engelhardtia mirabilis TaxID=2528011 RepID=A0A518BF38_9BACT|nr:hypothetical protein Pla133_06650 [Planctomycetes bacterium Pla133]QDU99925.1 hypothetical protein Pla86_06640 [Planctomycetes bacterium Pla86]
MSRRTARRLTVATAFAAGPFAAVAAAGDWVFEPVVLKDDTVAGIGLVDGITDLALNDNGNWAIAVNTSFPDTFANSVVLIDGAVYYREGDPVPGVLDTGLNGFGQLSLDDTGKLASDLYTWPLSGGFNAEIVHWGGHELFRSGDNAPATSYGQGALWASFSQVLNNSSNQILLHASVDDPNTAAVYDQGLHLMTLDDAGSVLVDVLMSKTGDNVTTASGATQSVESIHGGPHSKAISENGICMWLVDASGPAAFEISALINGTPVVQEGGPSPLLGRTWKDLSYAPLDINSKADWVIQGKLSGDSATEHLIAVNGQKLVQSGDPVPGVPGATILNFSQTAPLQIDEGGQVLWIGTWLDGGLRNGLFIDHEPLVVEGLTTFEGATFIDVYAFQDGFAMAPDGTRILFRGVLDDGRNGVFSATLEAGVEVLAGCSGNPMTLTVSAPPALGQSIVFDAAGSDFAIEASSLFLSALPVIPGSPCGVPLGVAGELLVALSPAPLQVPMVGSPGSLALTVPALPALAGADLYAQGASVNLGGGLDLLRLTNGLRLCLGE